MSDGNTTGSRLDEVLSPGAGAIVAFTLAVLVLTGNNLMVQGTQSLFNDPFDSRGMTEYLVTWGIGGLVPAVVSLLLARRALTTVGVSGWELVLARAAFVLAVVAVFYGVLVVVGALVHGR